jgi:uncharacterized protein (TIGR02246 family)
MLSLQGKTAIITTAKYLGLSCVLAVLGCTAAQQPASAPPDTRAADEAAIRKLDADWVKAAATKQADAWASYYSDDAVVLPPNEKLANSKEAILKPIAEMLKMPGLSVTWHQTKVEVAKSGDLAYAYGTYDMSADGPKGKPITDHGKIVEVWKKQADGSWKCVVDTWNSDLPPAPAPAPAKKATAGL